MSRGLAPSSWLNNLLPLSQLQLQAQSGEGKGGGAGADPRWSDLHMERFFPRCVDLVRELVLACPRLTRDDSVIECNVGATMGRASLALLGGTLYPWPTRHAMACVLTGAWPSTALSCECVAR